MRRLLPAPLLLAAVLSLAATDYTADGRRWWSHVEMLAGDAMEGRNTGSEGHRKAARYVAQEFERAGLKPAGTSGYLQPVKFVARQLLEDQSGVWLVRDGKPAALALGEDAQLSARGDLASSVDAKAVFAGHSLVVPEAHYDDLAGLDLKGKIAVFLTGGPDSIPGPLKAHYSSLSERWAALNKAGAIGMVLIANPRTMDIPWARSTLARLRPSMTLADPALAETEGLQFSMTMNPAHAGKLFAGSGHTFTEILSLADANKPVPRFPLAVSIRARQTLKRWDLESPNVAGILTGSDARLRGEYVVLSAHLDHLGIGEPIHGDRIYNGAMDDASGVASVLEVARMLKTASPRRSVVCLAVTGEEKGLLGSKYFSTHPTVPAGAIVADINLDMFLPLHPLHYLEVQGLGESTLGNQIRAAAARFGVEVQADKEPNRNLFIRSDQYSFIKQGVPALAFKFGYLSGSPEEILHKDWLRNRYHAPSDDLNQPVDKGAAAEFNHIILDLAERVANDPQRPQWNRDSFFRRFAR